MDLVEEFVKSNNLAAMQAAHQIVKRKCDFFTFPLSFYWCSPPPPTPALRRGPHRANCPQSVPSGKPLILAQLILIELSTFSCFLTTIGYCFSIVAVSSVLRKEQMNRCTQLVNLVKTYLAELEESDYEKK